MRARIDISEIEAETKIRAKYLRALENEEWGLLPGPAYVRSFLRTYAEALGLDAKLLLEEYKLRYERPSDHDLMPIGTSRRRGRGGGGPMRPPREPRRIPPGLIIGVIVLLLVAALYALGKSTGGGNDDNSASTTTATDRTTTTKVPASTTRTTKSGSGSSSSSSKKKKATSSKVVRLQIVASGTVFACLVDSDGTQRIKGVTLNDGQTAGPFRSKSFRLLLGNGNATVRVDGKVRSVPQKSPVAFRISKGKFTQVSPSSVPNCG